MFLIAHPKRLLELENLFRQDQQLYGSFYRITLNLLLIGWSKFQQDFKRNKNWQIK
jgi:hypothetical protein